MKTQFWLQTSLLKFVVPPKNNKNQLTFLFFFFLKKILFFFTKYFYIFEQTNKKKELGQTIRLTLPISLIYRITNNVTPFFCFVFFSQNNQLNSFAKPIINWPSVFFSFRCFHQVSWIIFQFFFSLKNIFFSKNNDKNIWNQRLNLHFYSIFLKQNLFFFHKKIFSDKNYIFHLQPPQACKSHFFCFFLSL